MFPKLLFQKLPEIALHQKGIVAEKSEDRPCGIDLCDVLDLQLFSRFCGGVRL